MQNKYRCKNPFWYLWSIVIILLLTVNLFQVISILREPGPLRACVFIYAFFAAVLGACMCGCYRKSSKMQMAIFIFAGALMIRLIALFFGDYILSNDFENYFNLGNYFYSGNYEQILSTTQKYGIPKLAGIGILYGTLEHIFSPTLLGVKLINCIFTSIVCVEIYLLLALQSNRAAAISAFLYMVYPTSIISSQITTNHHAATVFLLAAFYSFFLATPPPPREGAIKKGTVLLIVSTAALLVLSDLMHPSAIIAICALIAFCITSFVSNFLHRKSRFEKGMFRILFKCACVCILYAVILNSSLMMMESAGLCKADSTTTVLSKIRVGLDVEHDGRWWPGGYGEVQAIEDIREQRMFCIQEIKRNLKNPSAVLRLMWRKTDIAWFDGDGYYSFYFEAKSMQLSEEISKAESLGLDQEAEEIYKQLLEINNRSTLLSRFDALYIYAIWVFALIGLIALIRTPETTILDLTTWLPVGWMAFIIISEMQARYRYQSMPFVIMLSGFGISSIYGMMHTYFNKTRARKSFGNNKIKST